MSGIKQSMQVSVVKTTAVILSCTFQIISPISTTRAAIKTPTKSQLPTCSSQFINFIHNISTPFSPKKANMSKL